MKNAEYLDVVDENDNVIGREARSTIHKEGLLHREINIIVVNGEHQVLLQKRALHKDTFPGLWDVSVGGHVPERMEYRSAALKELSEEIGFEVKPEDLISLWKYYSPARDAQTGAINNKFKQLYLYKLKDADQIKMEEGEATELRFWTIDELENLSDRDKKNFTFLITKEGRENFKKIAEQIRKL